MPKAWAALLGVALLTIAVCVVIMAVPVADCGSVFSPSGNPRDFCEESIARRQGLWFLVGAGAIWSWAALSLRNDDHDTPNRPASRS